VKPELLIVVGSDPLRGVDGALLEGWIDVATCDLLRDETKLSECLAGPAADAHLQAFEVAGLFDFFIKPAAHLASGVTHEHAFGIELGTKIIDQLLAIAFKEPCVLLARIETEWHGAEQRPCRVFANVVVLRAMTHLDGAVLDRVQDLEARNNFAGRKSLNL